MPFILQVIRKEKNIPVVSPVTLMLCLWAASMTAGTRSSAGSPWSSATPGGYQDKTRTPGFTMEWVRYAVVLTGHFIRYTCLVKGWTPNSSQHTFNKVLETYWHDISWHIYDARLPFHHTPKVRLDWSVDRGGHLSTVNPLSCSRNQFETLLALGHGALACWWVQCGHKGMGMVLNNNKLQVWQHTYW